MISENDRRAERERREMEQDAEAAEAAAELNAAEEDDFDSKEVSDLIEALAMAGIPATEPDIDLTEAVEMDSLEDLAEAEALQEFVDEE